MKKFTTVFIFFASAFSFSQSCNLLNHACTNTTGLNTSGITANAGSIVACMVGNYVLYSTSSGNPYIATEDLLINQGNSATLHFQAKKSSTYSGIAEIWVHVGGYCNFNVYTTPFNTNGWVQIGTFNPTTMCASYGPFAVPSDIIGGNMISYCIVLKNASSTNWVSIDDICVSQIAGSAVPTTYTETFGTSSTGWYPSTGYIGVPYHTYKSASDAYVILGAGQAGGIDKGAYFYTGFDFCSTVSGTGIVTKEINTAGYTNGEVRISFKSRYPCSGTLSYTFDEDYTSYAPEVYIMEGPDNGSNAWVQLPVNYYFSDYTWRDASYDISAYKNSNIRIKVERGGFCGTSMEAVDNIKILDRNCAISLLSCGTITGPTAAAVNTDYSYSVPSVVGATYYKWFVRSEGNLYEASPYIVSGQGTQNVTINFGSLPTSGLRVLCIPYDANPAVVADACYAEINYLGVTLTTSVPLEIGIDFISNVSCFGADDGVIIMSNTGGISPFTYSWQPSVSSNVLASNLAPGSYEITVTDADLNQAVQTVVVTGPDEIVISGLSDQLLCSAFIYTPALAVSGGSGVYSYSWSPTSDVSNPSILNPDFSPSSTTTYTLTATDGDGCIETGQFEIEVNSPPTPIFTANMVSGCAPLSVSFSNLTIGSSSCEFTFGDGNSFTGCTGINNTYLNPGSYNVTLDIIGSNGCQNSITYNSYIQVNVPPVINLGGPYTFCDGDNLILDAGTGYVSYNWNTTETSQTVSVNTSGVYSVSATGINGCIGTGDVTATAVEPPSVFLGVDIITCDNAVLLDAGIGYDTYLWSTLETSQTIIANSNANYWVEISVGPCTNVDTISVEIRDCSQISELNSDEIIVYPNPINDFVVVQNVPLNTEIILFDINGKILSRSISENNSVNINTSNLSHGSYLIVVKSENKIYRWQLIK